MRDGAPGEHAICRAGRNWEFSCDAQTLWLTRTRAKGWTTQTMRARTCGGAGLTGAQDQILTGELKDMGALLPLQSFGLWMLGPGLLHFGTHEQKLEYLVLIARGQVRRCQDYSEPGAGSDLASVQTRAVIDADSFAVNGYKLWTSCADKADWIFAPVRTNPEVPKHKGILCIPIDMTSPGVSTRPIRPISDKSPSFETFFGDDRTPRDQRAGTENRRWDMAKYLLNRDREMISGGDGGLLSGRPLGAMLAETEGGLTDATLPAEALACEVDTPAMALTLQRYKTQAETPEIGDASAMLKCAGTELNKRRHDPVMKAKGSNALVWDDGDAGDDATLAVSLAKAWARLTAQLAVQEAVWMHGGIDTTDGFDMGFYMKRARVSAEGLGDYRYHADTVARPRGV